MDNSSVPIIGAIFISVMIIHLIYFITQGLVMPVFEIHELIIVTGILALLALMGVVTYLHYHMYTQWRW